MEMFSLRMFGDLIKSSGNMASQSSETGSINLMKLKLVGSDIYIYIYICIDIDSSISWIH